MNRIRTYLGSVTRTTRTILLGLAVVFVSAGIAQAATTISTNIETAGTLSVTGVSTFTNASTTNAATIGGTLWVGGNATTTPAGALTLNGAFSGTSGTLSTTLSVTGVSTFTNASTTNSATIAGPLWINGNATTTGAGALSLQSTLGVIGDTTLASTTATAMKVGQVGTRMTRIVSGYCVTAPTALPASFTASSTPTFAECTPSGGTSILSSTDRVFVQATSSLPSYIILQSASTTAGNLISTQLLNTSTSTSPATAIYAFNFWAFL